MTPLELWAGPECTVNRVGDDVRDQLEETGFATRLEDLDRLAELGVRRIRFPLLWERTWSVSQAYDWSWADARVERMRQLNLRCVVGLVHHGSGPRHTSLLDDGFASGLQNFAAAVARRYPELDAYTPVNEPLTTARFSGLYGLWYPHGRDDASFVRMLVHQVIAVSMAMQSIREINPAAKLVQTDDLGFTRAVPELQYQADFENERRWLAFDLLCGQVDRRHGLWRYLRRHGAAETELARLQDLPCPPDVIGINSYVTSERFLDDRLARYPGHPPSGNGHHRYVDIETVRVQGHALGGFKERLREAWHRYGIPIAMTEVHLGCTREEQMRWLLQAWRSAQAARAEGIDVGAVTAWAAFGTLDWDQLVTRRAGHYEPGLWDVRSDPPRPTALAGLARELGEGREPSHPVLAGSGWWQRAVRHLGAADGPAGMVAANGRPLLISGASGTLGRAFARMCHLRGLPFKLLDRATLDIADAHSVEAALARFRPWALVNAAGFVRVDEAEQQPRQWRENVVGPATLARACAHHDVRLLTFSSDLVFDGEKTEAYVESDRVNPLNAYGEAKAEAERRVLSLDRSAIVVRTAAFFGPWDAHNFVTRGLGALRGGERWKVAADQVVSPTYVRDLVMASLDLLVDGETGIWHLANQGAVSWHRLATLAARAAGEDPLGIQEVSGESLGQIATRPRHVWLDSERGRIMPSLDDALGRYVREAEHDVWPDADHEAFRLIA